MDPYDHDLERGMRNRRAILGDAWVDKSVANANAFNADFQNFITRYAWNDVWGRPGLDAKTRRIIVLAITCALGRWEEYELHLRAALTGGSGAGLGAGDHADTRLTPDEVKEVLMQAAIYAGVPAANTGVVIATRLLRELGHELPPLAATEAVHPGTGRSRRSHGSPALHYTLREPRSGAPAPYTFVLSHALGCDASLWDELANALAAQHRVICYDHRGHGDSDAPPGPYTMAALAQDAERLLAELQTGPVIWVGLSLGGMVGQELALRHPERLKALVIANSSSGLGHEGRSAWQQRIDAIEHGGLEAVADAAMQRWFSESFRQTQAATVARWRRRVVSTPVAGYLGASQAVMHMDSTARLPQIAVPTLVISGNQDQGTPLAMSQTIAQAVPNARLVVIDGAAHLSVLEQPGAFEAAVRDFIGGL
ncbi:3-oxoadipate enol-lactonase [Methylibium sp.]|uniref:bifunctional 4-carboxymuconolactone decarboxylase/3-oxoadipate enol-lactonase PcaCD n=2 Tax=Methylibium sp. TaxID=2067992 RepID=UPI00180A3545|nr:3-oxoadipate enol-lactonase [Methylibium sp.]MBA3591822.1 3-oxoadipate enol-lactonase [Methylibium sp.]